MPEDSIIPAAYPPPGIIPNFDGRAAKAESVTIITAIFLSIAIIAVGLRLYTRIHLVRLFGLDDYIIIFALILSAMQFALVQKMLDYGVGKHLWDVPLSTFSPKLLKVWMVGAVSYSATMLAVKLSILLLYRRIFPLENFRIQWWLTVAVTIGYSVGGMCASIFSCTPVAKSWDVTISNGHCINTGAFYIANGILNVITDLVILALPIPILWNLALTKKKKIALSILFAAGSLTCVVSMIRVGFVVIFLKHGSTDPTYSILPTVVWGFIEYNCAIVCSCALTIRPLLQRYFGGIFASGGSDGIRTSGFHYGYSSKQQTRRPFKSFGTVILEENNDDNVELSTKPSPQPESTNIGWAPNLNNIKDIDSESQEQILNHVNLSDK